MLTGNMRSRFTIHKSIPARQVIGRVAWFVLVGSAAAFVHWSVVVALVEHVGWRPLWANLVGWLVAFTVSFSGHHHWTFRNHGTPVQRSALRFFIVSAGGFAANESVYALMLQWSNWRYDLVLATVLVGVAAVTYVLGRHWAFSGSPGR